MKVTYKKNFLTIDSQGENFYDCNRINGSFNCLMDALDEHDIVSATELGDYLIACDGLLFELRDFDVQILLSGGKVELPLEGFVKDSKNKDFVKWYFGEQ